MKTLSLFILTSFFYILGISTLSAANWKVYVAKYKQDKQGASSKLPRMTWDELKQMAKNGHEISNHSWSHQNAKRLTLEQVKSEIEKNDSAIFANIGVMPVTYCYPYNYKTDEIVALASKNRVGTRTKQISIGGKSTPQRFAKWLDDLMTKEEWGVGMTHGINYGYDAFKEPSLFWEHLDKVKSLEDKIWVGIVKWLLI